MTQKRFVYYEHKGADYILDTPNKSLDFIEMLGDCLEAEEIVDLLNCLNDENEQLKKRIKEAIIHYDQATQTLNEKFDKMSGFEELPVAMSAIGFDIKNKWVFDLDSILYIILSI